MIRNITYMSVYDISSSGTNVVLPVIPSSATIDISEDEDEQGRFRRTTLNAIIDWEFRDEPILSAPLGINVVFAGDVDEDGREVPTNLFMGTPDRPVIFKKHISNVCAISTEYIEPI